MSYHRETIQNGDKLEDANLHLGEATLNRTSKSKGKTHKSRAGSMNESMANLCSVCFACEPDSVYMKCGHGGICYQCAVDIWRSTGECYLCRDQIEQVLQVEPKIDENGNEYLKVVASTQLVDEDEVEDDTSRVEYIE